jgi:hypothetical protein
MWTVPRLADDTESGQISGFHQRPRFAARRARASLARLDKLKLIPQNDRPFQWQGQVEAKVAALTPEQVSAAFRKCVDPAALTFVKAGDFKKAGVW